MPMDVDFALLRYLPEHRHTRTGACKACPINSMVLRRSDGWDLRIENNGLLRVRRAAHTDRYLSPQMWACAWIEESDG